ncbi:hypothetical protein CO540_11430 [Micromonospora sp. WMMA2032]|uniref:hypothetical protein n=1 Tax=Micromonospora sp. WMMA2032 TaxID=2039870 RepID=UPI000C059F9E|nr:hypothetical protein [Micromonospora sp. WMMA2032]ATO14348.1 hypothetical protein CO540_11430 [Micromonospora sp. WMMA2032]
MLFAAVTAAAGVALPGSSAAAAPSWNCSTPVVAHTYDSDSSGGWWNVDVSMSCTGSAGARTYSVYAYKRPGGAELFHDSALTNDQTYAVSFTIPAAPLGSADSACVVADSKVEVPELPGDSGSKNVCWPLSWGSAATASSAPAGVGGATSAATTVLAGAGTRGDSGTTTRAGASRSGPAASGASAADPPFCQTLGSSWSTSTQGRSGTVTVNGRCDVSRADYQADMYVNGEFWVRKTGSVSGVGDGGHTITLDVPTMPAPNDSRGNFAWVKVSYTSGATFANAWEEELGYLPCTGC